MEYIPCGICNFQSLVFLKHYAPFCRCSKYWRQISSQAIVFKFAADVNRIFIFRPWPPVNFPGNFPAGSNIDLCDCLTLDCLSSYKITHSRLKIVIFIIKIIFRKPLGHR